MEFELKGSHYGVKSYKEYDIKDCELLDYYFNINKLNVSKKRDEKKYIYIIHLIQQNMTCLEDGIIHQ